MKMLKLFFKLEVVMKRQNVVKRTQMLNVKRLICCGFILICLCNLIIGYGVSKVVSPYHGVAAPVYGGYGGYGAYGSYGGVSKIVSPVAAYGMYVVRSFKKPQPNYHTLINFLKLDAV